MSDVALLKLDKIETMLAALLQMQGATMRFDEVQRALGVKSKQAVYNWLEKHGLKSKSRRYDRASVVCALRK